MRLISHSNPLKPRQSRIIPGAVCNLRDSRAGAASPNNKKKRAPLSSFDNKATEEPSHPVQGSGILSKIVSAAVDSGKLVGGALATAMVSTILNSALSILLSNLTIFISVP
jgi:hypothetical protein